MLTGIGFFYQCGHSSFDLFFTLCYICDGLSQGGSGFSYFCNGVRHILHVAFDLVHGGGLLYSCGFQRFCGILGILSVLQKFGGSLFDFSKALTHAVDEVAHSGVHVGDFVIALGGYFYGEVAACNLFDIIGQAGNRLLDGLAQNL